MSTTVISQGFIAVLKKPIKNKELEDLSESLYESSNGLHINYDGTLIYFDAYSLLPYSKREFYSDLFIVGAQKSEKEYEFISLLCSAGFEIEVETVKPYTCVWYNGADSPMSTMTKEEFVAY